MTMKSVSAISALFLGMSFSLAAHANPYETQLRNGLRVIVKEDHRAPTVVNMIWYRAGSMDEKDGYSGVAHALEHLMFKGTRKYKSGEFNRIVAAAGGNDNAFTSRDYTAYFQIVPKRALPKMMELEADRMKNLAFTQAEFASEIKVVMEERRMRTEDNPHALVYEAMNAAAYKAHPYRRPVIGWMDDLEHMSWQDAMNWYKDWYTPSNAYVVIVGDVNKDEVFKLAEKYYGGIKPHALPERKPQNEPEQKGIKRIVVKDVDPYALEVLAAVLDGHDAARFSRTLVRETRVAQSAGAGYDATLRGESMFYLDGQPGEGRSVAELEAALRDELRKIREQGVDEAELKRVKVQLVAGQVYKRDSMMAQAMEIGGIEAAGFHWRDIDRMLEKLKAVTAEQVQAVANKYFSDDVLTVATLDPQPIDPKAAPKPAVPLKH